MKRNKLTKSISALLARYFVTFTGILILIFVGLYLSWDYYFERLLFAPAPETLIEAPAFLEGDYKEVDVSRYLGEDSGFAVYDEQSNLIYSSSSKIPSLSPSELECISLYDSSDYTILSPFTTPEGEERWLLTREMYLEDGSLQAQVAILDSDYQLVAGQLDSGRTGYTRQELDYLTSQWSTEYILTRIKVTGSQGEALTLVLLLPQMFNYSNAAQKAGRLWLLAIPLCIGVIFAFICLLDRQLRLPLARLEEAIRRLGTGEEVCAQNCGGPEEVVQLGRTFDQMARQLAESQAEALKLEQQRVQMLTDISHDLKTPITVIAGYANAIRDGKIPPQELNQYLATIAQKTEKLNGLIQQFYEYSQTQHPDFHLTLTNTDLCEFLREYLAEKFNEIELAGFSLDVKIPDGKTLFLSLDPFQLGRALDNILSNALRYNPPGTTIGVSLSRNREAATLLLWDSGEGIPASLRENLFTPFAVGDQSRSKGGSGLGLSISEKIIRAHGWSIQLAPSTPKTPGTVFKIRIPLT